MAKAADRSTNVSAMIRSSLERWVDPIGVDERERAEDDHKRLRKIEVGEVDSKSQEDPPSAGTSAPVPPPPPPECKHERKERGSSGVTVCRDCRIIIR